MVTPNNYIDVQMNTPLTDKMIDGFLDYFSKFFNQNFEYTDAGRHFQIHSNDYNFLIKASFIQSTTELMEQTLGERLDATFSGVTFVKSQHYILDGDYGKYRIKEMN
ncbi:hypothetical protein [Vibrio caribbeanicus]|uniref:hypothetical protein n=1 Tax=Vibrio caribbeanicus TaxID=701175 RepID=UPI0022843BBB|nr:hypothetical protein [Vibrio caribbeanicus]MCY9843963.1 hypothetical protein [Vibrio caribbeanicus]